MAVVEPTEKMLVNIPASVKLALRSRAESEGVSMSELVNRFLSAALGVEYEKRAGRVVEDDLDRVYRVISDNQPLTRSSLIRATRLPAARLDAALARLLSVRHVRKDNTKGNGDLGRSVTIYRAR